MSKKSEHEQVIADESAATVREGARQAMIDRDQVIAAAYEAERVAASCDTAPEAKQTFWQKLKESLGFA